MSTSRTPVDRSWAGPWRVLHTGKKSPHNMTQSEESNRKPRTRRAALLATRTTQRYCHIHEEVGYYLFLSFAFFISLFFFFLSFIFALEKSQFQKKFNIFNTLFGFKKCSNYLFRFSKDMVFFSKNVQNLFVFWKFVRCFKICSCFSKDVHFFKICSNYQKRFGISHL